MTIDVPITVTLESSGSTVTGKATLESPERTYEVVATAPRHEDGSTDAWSLDLATARLLRRLEVDLIERVHERIDRYVVNE
jgi:hypothetical protein